MNRNPKKQGTFVFWGDFVNKICDLLINLLILLIKTPKYKVHLSFGWILLINFAILLIKNIKKVGKFVFLAIFLMKNTKKSGNFVFWGDFIYKFCDFINKFGNLIDKFGNFINKNRQITNLP